MTLTLLPAFFPVRVLLKYCTTSADLRCNSHRWRHKSLTIGLRINITLIHGNCVVLGSSLVLQSLHYGQYQPYHLHQRGPLISNEDYKFIERSSNKSDHGTAMQVLRRWLLRGNKGKRTGVPSARVSLLAFTTPKQFPETVWLKMLSAENGLAKQVLLFYQKKEEKDLEVMAQHCKELDNYPIQSQ